MRKQKMIRWIAWAVAGIACVAGGIHVYQKYQERIKSIQEAEIKEKEREKKRNIPKRGRKKKEETKIEIKPLR